MLSTMGQMLLSFAVALIVVLVWQTEIYAPVTRGFRGALRTKSRESKLFRVFDFWVRFATVTSLRSKKGVDQHTEQELVSAGELWGFEARELRGASVVLALLGMCVGAVVGHFMEAALIGALCGAMLFAYFPKAQLATQTKEREKSIERALPFVMDLIYMTMGAGLDFSGALRKVVERLPKRKSPIRFELDRLLRDISLGTSRSAAMRQFGERNRSETSQDFAHWVIQSEEKGTPLRDVLRKQSSSLRERRSVLAEESAARAGAAMMIPMMMMFLCILILVLAPLLTSFMGARL